MSKINKSDSNGVYTFSFSLKITNPFEKAVLDRLNELIRSGCSKKEAIMTLMAKSVIDNFNLDAPIPESVQFQEGQVLKEVNTDKNITMSKNIEVTKDNQIEFAAAEEVSQKSQNQQAKVVEHEQGQVNSETTKNFNDEQEKRLQAIIKGMYK